MHTSNSSIEDAACSWNIGKVFPTRPTVTKCKLIEMWLNLCNAVGLVPGLDENKAALLRSLSRDADDNDRTFSSRRGVVLIVRVSCIFRLLGIGR